MAETRIDASRMIDSGMWNKVDETALSAVNSWTWSGLSNANVYRAVAYFHIGTSNSNFGLRINGVSTNTYSTGITYTQHNGGAGSDGAGYGTYSLMIFNRPAGSNAKYDWPCFVDVTVFQDPLSTEKPVLIHGTFFYFDNNGVYYSHQLCGYHYTAVPANNMTSMTFVLETGAATMTGTAKLYTLS